MKRSILTLVGFVTTVFAMLVALGSVFAPEVKAAPGTGTLFGTDASGGNLMTIDPLTGVGILIGFMGAGVVPALAVDPTTDVLYAGEGGGAPNLYTVDPTTGAATLIGDTGLGFASIGGMDFSADGTLYAVVNIAGNGGTGSDHLAILDQTTGAAAVIGPFGTCTGVTIPSAGGGSCTLEGIEAIAFDASGTLWGARNARGAAGSPGLYTIDPATGAATFVAPILDASGTPPSGGVVSLQFACDGTLYGGTATAVSPASDGGRLITIDPATGLFSFVGAVSATPFGTSLGALAFQAPCAAEDLATILGNSGFEADLVHSQWTATKPNKTYQFNAPVVNPTIVPKGTTTAVQAPAGNNFVGILNPRDTNISGKLVHTVVAGAFAQGTTFEVTVFANRGRLAGASTPLFDSAPSEVQVRFFGWGTGSAPTMNPNTDNWSRRPIVDIRQSFTHWAANGEWAFQTFAFSIDKDIQYLSLAIAGINHKNASYVAFDID